jgi:hypothetical protein
MNDNKIQEHERELFLISPFPTILHRAQLYNEIAQHDSAFSNID